MVVHIWTPSNPSSLEAEVGGVQIQGQLGLQRETVFLKKGKKEDIVKMSKK